MTPADKGWLRPAEAAALVEETFGLRVAERTVQAWTKRTKNPLPAVLVGSRLLIHRDALLNWCRPVRGEIG